MRDELLHYYERELAWLRKSGAEFAARYPKVAARLQLEATKCDDPHVERLLEGFAFLAARVHLRIDDDFSELVEALLNVVHPHYTRPIPPMSLVQFHLDPEQGKLTGGLFLPRGTPMVTRPVGGVRCTFRTCFDTTIWPITVEGARWTTPGQLSPPLSVRGATAALSVQLSCLQDVTFGALELETLRFHLAGDAGVTASLYELLCNNCLEIVVRDPDGGSRRESVHLSPSALVPVGFGENEGMFPLERRSLVGYRLLQEYFTFPEKFHFLDLGGLGRLRDAGLGRNAEVVFLFSRFQRPERREVLETGVERDTIRLGCTPVVNLFPRTSEPVFLNRRRHEYPLVADNRNRDAVGIYSVDDVVGVTPGSREPLHYTPFYALRHGRDRASPLYWYARRHPAARRPDGRTSVTLSFVDLAARPAQPAEDAVTVRLTCHNGDLPSRLPFGDPGGDLQLEGGGPIRRVQTLVRPTRPIEPPLGTPAIWRLVSLLSLNYLSLEEGGVEGLQELLRLHNPGQTTAGEQNIQGIRSLRTTPTHARVENRFGISFARGHRVELELDEENFAGGNPYLFAAVLECFMGLHTSLNSFTILAVRTRQRPDLMREWPPRSGWKRLL